MLEAISQAAGLPMVWILLIGVIPALLFLWWTWLNLWSLLKMGVAIGLIVWGFYMVADSESIDFNGKTLGSLQDEGSLVLPISPLESNE